MRAKVRLLLILGLGTIAIASLAINCGSDLTGSSKSELTADAALEAAPSDAASDVVQDSSFDAGTCSNLGSDYSCGPWHLYGCNGAIPSPCGTTATQWVHEDGGYSSYVCCP